MRDHSETKLTIAVADYLRGEIHHGKQIIRHGVPFPDLLWAFVANEGRSEADGAKFKRMGIRRGMADFIIWYDGGYGAIELKSAIGKQSSYQKDFQVRFEKLKGHYAICRSVQEVRDTLVSWGLKCHYNACIEPTPSLQTRYKDSFNYFARPK